jgi:hypothetical protein
MTKSDGGYEHIINMMVLVEYVVLVSLLVGLFFFK